MPEFDLIVLGGGTGGLYSAVLVANEGRKVALIEKDKLAGTCLNYGCTPTKSIFYSAKLFSMLKKSRQFGIECSGLALNFSKVMERTQKIVRDGRKRNESKVKENVNIELFSGIGKFSSENEVLVGSESVSAETIFIATGASPQVPPIEGLDSVEYLTYKTILGLTTLPKSLIIIGGGFIGVEYASALNSFGTKVTIIERGDKLISQSNSDISGALEKYFREDGIDVRTRTGISKVENGEKGESIVTTRGGDTINGQRLLIAVGLKPNTVGLNLKECNVELNPRGFIHVDEFLRTSNKHIWAFGDVIGKKMFTHAALNEAETTVNNAFSKPWIKFNETSVPYAVFTEPEIGSVGMTEKDAIEKELKFSTKKAYYSDTARGIITNEKRGFVTLIYEGENILGCHAIGNNASTLVSEVTALMNSQSPYKVFNKVVHTHPTLPEIFDELKT